MKKAEILDNIDRLITDLVAQQISVVEQNTLFKSVLNIGNIYIVDIESNTILYANDRLKKQFGKDIEGKTCHEVFQGDYKPCPFCTNDTILKQEDEPYYWVYFNPITKEVYIIADVYVKLKSNGTTAHVRFEIAIPVDNKMKTDLEVAWRMKL